MSIEQLVKDWDPLLAQLLPGSSPLHRAAIWGQMGQESNFRPDAIEKPGTNEGGIGLLQWTGSRRKDFESFAVSQGKNWRDIETQIRFIAQECLGPENHAWIQTQKTTSPDAAAQTFMLDYERPAASTANLKRRVNDTYAALAVIQAAQPGANPVTDTSGTVTPVNTAATSTNALAQWIKDHEVPAEQVIRSLLVAKGFPGFLVDLIFSALNPLLDQLIENIKPEDIGNMIVKNLIQPMLSNLNKKTS
jgi:hypothetical protein